MQKSNSPFRVLFASLIGTTIEFFDFYIYATAAVLVFPKLFFPEGDATTAALQSLATFALAFFARPIGSALFGHYGDRIGRKATLVAALMTMGISTVCIGLLPTYESIGIAATLLLCLCRVGQGIGLGGEWGGAVLLAIENAPEKKRAWYGMFPQLGAPIGFFFSTGVFLLLTHNLSEADFFSWGWRIPFVASALLVIVGLYVRLSLEETPAFKEAIETDKRVRVPMLNVMTQHTRVLILGAFLAIASFAVFYITTVFSLGWGTSKLGYTREDFLILQLYAVFVLMFAICFSALIADRIGRRAMMMISGIAVAIFGLSFSFLLSSGSSIGVLIALSVGFAVMGLTYGPVGTALAEIYPTEVRYTGASLSFNLAGIIGASLTPAIANWLGTSYGLSFVGYYISVAGMLTLLAAFALSKDLAKR
ncbi:MAG: MFS transporter [Cellvibrio sp.]|uniref:MFS transporter n=1 Tax=Cellvibrio sp. TaxID=1965322 RepID=UPI0031A6FC24